MVLVVLERHAREHFFAASDDDFEREAILASVDTQIPQLIDTLKPAIN